MTLDSMELWLASWGDGPNWSDPTGATVPVTKEALAALIANAKKMRTALAGLRSRALGHAPGASREFAPATAASIAIICEDAIDGV